MARTPATTATPYQERLAQWRERPTTTVTVEDPEDGSAVSFELQEPRGSDALERIVEHQAALAAIAESDEPREAKETRQIITIYRMYRTMLQQALVGGVSDDDVDVIATKFGIGSSLYDEVMRVCRMDTLTSEALAAREAGDAPANRQQRRAARKGKSADLPFGSRGSAGTGRRTGTGSRTRRRSNS